MKSKPDQNLKEKSHFLKNKKKRNKAECPCIRFILSILKSKKQSTCLSTESNKSVLADKRIESESFLKKTKKTRVIRLPRIGCTIPFLMTLFNDLSKEGTMNMEASDISRAVNIILKAKMDLDGGSPWNGKIQIAENLHLKLYKSGLVLHHKK